LAFPWAIAPLNLEDADQFAQKRLQIQDEPLGKNDAGRDAYV